MQHAPMAVQVITAARQTAIVRPSVLGVPVHRFAQGKPGRGEAGGG